MRVLVVGATGALAPAVGALAARGHTVYALARGAAAPVGDAGSVVAVPVDHSDVDALRAALDALPPFDAALIYAPHASAATRATLAGRVDGTLVELFTSEHADPERAPQADPAGLDSVGTPLLLGWTAGRWHTPQEISAAAVRVLDDPGPDVLGAVRPWAGRPG